MVKANPERSYQGNPEGIKWPTDKAEYDKNYEKIFMFVKTTGGKTMEMKQFDEWWKEGESGGRGRCHGKKACKTAWRATLEWVLALYWDKGNNPDLFQKILEDELGIENENQN